MKSCETSAFFRVQTLATIFEKSQHCIYSWQWSYVFRPADREQSWLLHLINILHVCVCFLLPLYEGEGRVDASCRYYCVIHLRRPALIDIILVRILFSVTAFSPDFTCILLTVSITFLCQLFLSYPSQGDQLHSPIQ